jgi:YegS/Rv2252/BmrU family lipid kinase
MAIEQSEAEENAAGPPPDGAETGRNRAERICLIANPRAAGGRVGKRLDDLRRLVDQTFERWDLRVTEGPSHATELAAAAVEEGFDIVAAVGGDGTCHEVVNGLVPAEASSAGRTIFTVIPFGTGSDLVRSLEIPTPTEQALRVASTGLTVPTDVGRVRYTLEDGRQQDRRFINVSGFGANGAVVARVNAGSKSLGGTMPFVKAVLQTLVSYRAQPVSLHWDGPDGEGQWEGNLLSAFVANGFYCGGGMRVGKDASMHDGHFALTVVSDASLIHLGLNLPRLFTGTIHKAKSAFRVNVRSLRVEPMSSGQPLLIDLDGEQCGALPMQLKTLPGALQIRGGWITDPRAD